jgi:curved DNA-binding protein CbpA
MSTDSSRPAEDPREVLGVGLEANDEEIRSAYVRKVKENPPDRSPAAFERIRDAYETLRDPRARARQLFAADEPLASLASLLDEVPAQLRYVGPTPWLGVLKEKRS